MGDIILVRHGQANSQAQDEEGYDRLSDLGRQQSAWLGEWLRNNEDPFDRVLTGTLRRHKQTAEAMGFADVPRDPRLNELDYFNLGKALEDHNGTPMPGPEDFAEHAIDVMEAWHAAQIMGNETFASFEDRVCAVVREAAQPGVRVLCVTSGGVIGMVLRSLLGLDPRRMAHVLLPIRNSSLHRVHVMPHATILGSFNETPHLIPADRAFARTTY